MKKDEVIRICEEINAEHRTIETEEAELSIYIEAPASNQQFCVTYEDFRPLLEENCLYIKEGSKWYTVALEDVENIHFETHRF